MYVKPLLHLGSWTRTSTVSDTGAAADVETFLQAVRLKPPASTHHCYNFTTLNSGRIQVLPSSLITLYKLPLDQVRQTPDALYALPG